MCAPAWALTKAYTSRDALLAKWPRLNFYNNPLFSHWEGSANVRRGSHGPPTIGEPHHRCSSLSCSNSGLHYRSGSGRHYNHVLVRINTVRVCWRRCSSSYRAPLRSLVCLVWSVFLCDLMKLHLRFTDLSWQADVEARDGAGKSIFFRLRSPRNHLDVLSICQCQKTASGFGYWTWGRISRSKRKKETEMREAVEYQECPTSFWKLFEFQSFQNNGRSFSKDRSPKKHNIL